MTNLGSTTCGWCRPRAPSRGLCTSAANCGNAVTTNLAWRASVSWTGWSSVSSSRRRCRPKRRSELTSTWNATRDARITAWDETDGRADDDPSNPRFAGLRGVTEREIRSTRQALSLYKERQALVVFDREVATCASPASPDPTLADLARVRHAVLRCLSLAAGSGSSTEGAALPIGSWRRWSRNRRPAHADARTARGQSSVGRPGRDAGHRRASLLEMTDVIGEVFGTEDFCLFLYSLVRMQAPRPSSSSVPGTGVGVLDGAGRRPQRPGPRLDGRRPRQADGIRGCWPSSALVSPARRGRPDGRSTGAEAPARDQGRGSGWKRLTFVQRRNGTRRPVSLRRLRISRRRWTCSSPTSTTVASCRHPRILGCFLRGWPPPAPSSSTVRRRAGRRTCCSSS